MQLRFLLILTAALAACRPRPHVEPLAGPPVGVIKPAPSEAAPVPSRPEARDAPRRNILPPPPIIEQDPIDSSAIIAEIQARLVDAYFDYDRSDLRPDAVAALQHNAELLRPLFSRFPNARVTIEGHCDERGSAAYNLALGDQRARRAADFVSQLGLAPERVDMVSFGNEAPQCFQAAEPCWRLNRRAHFRVH